MDSIQTPETGAILQFGILQHSSLLPLPDILCVKTVMKFFNTSNRELFFRTILLPT